MPTSATVATLFPSSAEFSGFAVAHSRSGSVPAPFCMTLVDLMELEKWLQPLLPPDHLRSLLSSEEDKLFSSYTYSKRRREWLGGRLAAKSAVLQLLGIPPGPETIPAVSILPAAHGAPQLAGLPSSIPGNMPTLSISHSGRYAVAIAAAAQACGIDIQKISAKTEHVADRFCEEKELQLLQESSPRLSTTERLTLLWTAKEALKKAILHDQPVIFQGVVLESMEMAGHYSLYLRYPGDKGRPACVFAVQLEDCFLSSIIVVPSHA